MLLFIVPYFYMFPSSYDVQSQWNSNFGFPPRNIWELRSPLLAVYNLEKLTSQWNGNSIEFLLVCNM